MPSTKIHLSGVGQLFSMAASRRFAKCFPKLAFVGDDSDASALLMIHDYLPGEAEALAAAAFLATQRPLIQVFPCDFHILALVRMHPDDATPAHVIAAWQGHKPKQQWRLINAWQKQALPVLLPDQLFQALLHVLHPALAVLIAHGPKAMQANQLGCYALASQEFKCIPVYPRHQRDKPDLYERLARGVVAPALKKSPNNFRMRPVPDLGDFLKANTQSAFGLIQKFKLETDHKFYAPVRTSFLEYSNGTGHALSFRRSMDLAVLEAMERMAGATPRKHIPKIKKSYAALGETAIDPKALGLLDNYDHPSNHFFPDYDENLSIAWTQAYNLTHEKRVWLASQFAYHDPKYLDLPAMVFDTSNGCAAGGHPLEAIFFGLLEVIERDAFNMAWFNKLPCPQIQISSIDHGEFHLLADQVTAHGDTCHLFRLPTDVPVPVVLALLMRPQGKLGCLTVGTCAHPDPTVAAHSALSEALYHFSSLEQMVQGDLAGLRRKAADYQQVASLGDHVAVFGLPEMRREVAFLFGDDPRPLAAMDFPVFPQHGDLNEDVNYLVDWLKRAGYEVIIHDQTSPEQQSLGFHTVKVIIPGFLPVSFGTMRQRITSLDRLREIPVKLGLRTEPIKTKDINLAPHPLS